jgi:hypothetical protein
LTVHIGEASPEEVELYVLSSLRTPEAVARAADAGINDESWQVDDHAEAWKYVRERLRGGGEMPSVADVEAACGIALIRDVTDEDTFLSELVKRTIERQATRRILEGVEGLRDDPRAAVAKLIGDLSEISASTTAHSAVYDGSIQSRLDLMRERTDRKARGEVIGIRTGLRVLDDAGYTFRPGVLVCLQGPMNVGKSGLLLWFCARAYHHDRARILFLTPESTINDIHDRLDPMLARFRGYELSNHDLRMGTVDMDLYSQYVADVALDGRNDWITRDSGDSGVFSVGEIIQLAREHRPDIIAIDGVHLISGEGRTWERIKDAAEMLKGLAQSMGLVVIGGTQVTREAMLSDDPAELGQSAYGLAFLEASNMVISLATKRGDSMQRTWKLVKNRDGRQILARQYLRFDIDAGNLGDVQINVDGSTGIVGFD